MPSYTHEAPPPSVVPTRTQLQVHAMRTLAGAALVVLAAALVHRAGHLDQQWQYVAIAAALLPQFAVDALAVGDEDRRSRLRTSRRPALVPLLAAGVLVVVAMTASISLAATASALVAAAGLAVAGAPATVVTPATRRPGAGRPSPR
ncbi:hypothetical protein [Nocardioides mesophilus]|uniref:Uncharacterized protein n=1 Tax=Nocardioides mesophilus TaxID=433659 RepID=A0A7G9RB35_9ACTN|nr:hypothetical protein [Nocardioides mesophilus]QNN52810.1 hypothetical protein H9L09_20690 [Nocardioides mesophilus]